MGKERGHGRGFGKVILLGEHSVVYGHPALAVGLDRGALAEATHLDDGPSQLSIGSWSTEADSESDLGLAFAALLRETATTRAVHVRAQTDLLASAGLGCSAALAVAITRALLSLRGIEATQADIAARALAWEKVFHGNPSGIDTNIATRGGCLLFERAHDGPRIEALPIRAPLHLAIGYTGQPASTRAMVEGLARLRARKPEMVEKSFEDLSSLVGNAKLALLAGDLVGLGQLLDLGQMLLSGLMLSTPEIERVCKLARDAGALGAKLTGGGGGGCVIALAESSPEPILDAWAQAGFSSFAAEIAPATRPIDAGREGKEWTLR